MIYSPLIVSADGPITTVTLNRVEKRNALALREIASGGAGHHPGGEWPSVQRGP